MSRDALVVGLNHYQYLPSLGAPVQDAEAIAQRLSQDGEFRVQRLPEVIHEGQPQVGERQITTQELEAALVKLFKPNGLNVPDTALFYFSGHGIQKEAGISEGFLATSETDPNQGFYGLSLFWLRRLLQESPVRQRVIWLDCCHSGTFLDFLEADPGAKPGTSRFFMAAAREYEQAYESLQGGYSVFTEALLDGLDPHRVSEGTITNYALTDWVSTRLKGELQQPLFENSGSEILLTRMAPTDLAIAPPSPAPRIATLGEQAMAVGRSLTGEATLVRAGAKSSAVQPSWAEHRPARASQATSSQALARRSSTDDLATIAQPGNQPSRTDQQQPRQQTQVQVLEKPSAVRDDAARLSAAPSPKSLPPSPATAPPPPSHIGQDAEIPCPYPGLQAFEACEHLYFTGREALVKELLSALHHHNLVSVVGAASSGKTSLLQAGLLPALERRSRGGGERWQSRIIRPVNNPILDLAAAFIDAEASDWERNEQLRRNGELIASDERGLLRLVQAHCHPPASHPATGTEYDPREPRLLLIFDQFEHLLQTGDQPSAEQVCQHLINSILTLLQEESERVRVIIAVRSDYWEECYQRTELLQQGPSQLIPVDPLDREALKVAILKPALRLGWQCEINLADMLLEDILASPARLALLQLALRSIWLRQSAKATGANRELAAPDRVLQLSTYADMGRIRGLLVSQATDLLQELSDSDQALVQRIFLALTQLGDGTPDSLRRVAKSELGSDRGPQGADLAAILETLIESRLVVSAGNHISHPPNAEEEGKTSSWMHLGKSDDWVEASHEALIRDWPDLRGWINQQRDRLTRQRRIERQTEDWSQRDDLFDQEAWLQGNALQDAEAYLRDHPDDLSSLAQHFIHLSQDETKRSQRKGRLAQIGIAAALTAALLALMYQVFQQRKPVSPSQIAPAHSSQQYSSQAFGLNPRELYQRFARSRRPSSSDPARDLVTQQLNQTPMSSLLIGQLDLTPDQPESDGFEADLISDRRLRDQALPQLKLLGELEHTEALSNLRLSRDRKHLAGIDAQGQINLLSLAGLLPNSNFTQLNHQQKSAPLQRLVWPEAPANDVSNLVEGINSLTMRQLHNQLSLAEPAPGPDRRPIDEQINPPAVQSLSLSADGKSLASRAEGQAAITIWATGSGKIRHHITTLPVPVDHLEYSPTDANQLASAAGRRVYVWQANSQNDRPEVMHKLEHPAEIEHMQYSADGQWLLTSSSDRQLRLWDIHSGQLHQEMASSSPVVRMIMGDRRIATLGSDNGIEVWEQYGGDRVARLKLPSIIASQPEFRASELALSPQEDQLVVVLGQQGWNWNLSTGKLQSRFKVFAEPKTLPEEIFEPNDPLEANLLKQARPKPRRWSRIKPPSMKVFARPTLKFSPDGAQLLATRQREIEGETQLDAQLLNLHSGEVSDVLQDQSSAVVEATFDTDSNLLITVNQTGKLSLWETQPNQTKQKTIQASLTEHPQDGGNRAAVNPVNPANAVNPANSINVAAAVADVNQAEGSHRPNFVTALHHPTANQSLTQPNAAPRFQTLAHRSTDQSSPAQPAAVQSAEPSANNHPRPRQSLRIQPSDTGSLTFLLLDEAGQLQRWDSDSGQGFDLAPLVGAIAPNGMSNGIHSSSNNPNVTPPDSTSELTSAITASDSSDDQTTVATANADGQVTLWTLDPETGSPQGRSLSPVRATTSSVGKPLLANPTRSNNPASLHLTHLQLSRQGDSLLGLDASHRLHIWNSQTGEQMIWPQHLQDIRLVTISQDGQRILTADGQGTITLWDRNSGKAIQALGLPGLTAASLDPTGKMMAIALPEGTIKLIDADTGAVETTLQGHRSAVRDLAFSPDGDRLLSGGSAGGLRLWDLNSDNETRTLQYDSSYSAHGDSGDTTNSHGSSDYDNNNHGDNSHGNNSHGDSTKTLAPTPQAIHQVTFSEDGAYIAAADTQGIVRFWASDRESFTRLAQQRSAHQLELDRCLATVHTSLPDYCPTPPVEAEALQLEAAQTQETAVEMAQSLPAQSLPAQSLPAQSFALELPSQELPSRLQPPAEPVLNAIAQAAGELIQSTSAAKTLQTATNLPPATDTSAESAESEPAQTESTPSEKAAMTQAAMTTAHRPLRKASRHSPLADPWGTLEAFTTVLKKD